MKAQTILPALAIATVFLGLPIYFQAFPPARPVAEADGVYFNSCCDVIALKNGVMSFGRQQVSYAVEHDKESDYVLPKIYVRVRNGRLETDASKFPLKIRLSAESPPRKIMIDSVDNTVMFERK